MKTTRIAGIALALLALAAGPANAADKDGRFSVRSLGRSKCSGLTNAVGQKNNELIQLYAPWLGDYLTASNRLISQTFDAMPSTSASDAIGVVAVICRANVEALVETASYQALETLNSIRIRQDSPLVSLEQAGKTLTIRQEALIMAQTELARAGLFKGAADGNASPALAQAIRAFQKAQKLPETGLPDLDVLIRLKLTPTAKG